MTTPAQPKATAQDLQASARFGIDGESLAETGVRCVPDAAARESLGSNNLLGAAVAPGAPQLEWSDIGAAWRAERAATAPEPADAQPLDAVLVSYRDAFVMALAMWRSEAAQLNAARATIRELRSELAAERSGLRGPA
jgi:hypothetical protein